VIDAFKDAAHRFGFTGALIDAACDAIEQTAAARLERDAVALGVTAKVMRAFERAGISDAHLAGTTGYGYHDFGREAYEAILADVMDAEATLARVQLTSGTQAIVAAIDALAGTNGRVVAVTGRPYDTLRLALVDHPRALRAGGNNYEELPWAPGSGLDEAAIETAMRRKPAVVFIQRSRGYAPRPSTNIEEVRRLVDIVRRAYAAAAVVVDNCYGEFVEAREPSAVGADLAVGSLIKNPGGGMAPTGAYVAGTRAAVASVAERVFAPGLGAGIGPSLDAARWMFAGLHRAPRIVAESLKILDFAAALFLRLGYEVDPQPGAPRTDIIQAIRLGSADALCSFAAGLQRLLPVNPRARPEPGPVPGYAQPVIMASGAFVTGATIELSCDAPLREPFEVYLQGGMDVGHGMQAVTSAAAELQAHRRHARI
jgi:cystathionine beta-lyase family protein involved in aluminum resistance